MGEGVAVDAAGNAYLAGNSDVTDLPTTPGILTPTGSGAFVAKVNAAGTALSYLTYIGSGSQTTQPFFTPKNRMSALAVDASGNAYVAGTTWDPNLPLSNSFHGSGDNPPTDAYVMKLNPAGTAVVWGSYLGGDWVDQATAASLDSTGNFWVAGETRSTAFPNVDGWSTGEDFVVRYDTKGELSYSARSHRDRPEPSRRAHSYTAAPSGVASAVAASPRPPYGRGPSDPSAGRSRLGK
jgi:hypothetical protein